MKNITKKQILNQMVSREVNGWFPRRFGYYCKIGSSTFEKNAHDDNVYMNDQDSKDPYAMTAIALVNNKKEFVNAVFDFLTSNTDEA